MALNLSKIYGIEQDNINLQAGCILISPPFSTDNFFGRSVVLLIEYSEKTGAVGLILNKPIPLTHFDNNFIKDFDNKKLSISVGGPVETEKLFYIHTNSKIRNSTKIFSEIFWGGEYSQLKLLINNGELPINQIRFFVGYSGWTPGQLENEIKHKAWLVKKITSTDIFINSNNLWKKQVKQLDKRYKLWNFVPEDLQLN